MRIIHTSDWHLGQLFYGKSREQEQADFLEWLLQQITQLQADALIVAGDLFDTATPPSYARSLYNRFISRASQTGCQLIFLAGNHDSVAVINESYELMASLGVHVVAGQADDMDDRILTLHNPAKEPGAVLAAVPFLRPRDLLLSQAGQSGTDKQQHLQQAITAHYQHLFQQAQQSAIGQASDDQCRLPVIMTGHLTTVGALSSDSVRDIYIGTLDAFPASAFPPADYIALGHIHRSQKVGGSHHIRYCGSPVALSFDEAGKQKHILCVDLPDVLPSTEDNDEAQSVRVTEIPVPVFQPMATLQGTLDSISEQLDLLLKTEPTEETAEKTENTSLLKDRSAQRIWLDIEISTQDYLSDLQPRIEALCQDKPVDVLLIRRRKKAIRQMDQPENKLQLHELTPRDVFISRLAKEEDLEPDQAQRLQQHFDTLLAQMNDPDQTDDHTDNQPQKVSS